MNDNPFVLFEVIPMMHALGFTEEDVIRHVPHDGILSAVTLLLSRLVISRGRKGFGSDIMALPPYILMSFLRRTVTRRIAAMKNKTSRGVHYEAEKVRRRAMAAERRRVACRTTTSPCPSKEAVQNAWRHVRDSKESLIRFGSMMQDLECYVDNSLRFDGRGRIVGRNAGVKGWLRENVPEMFVHYTSVIRYKAAAKKLRQIVGLADPTPVEVVLGDTGMTPTTGASSMEATNEAAATGKDARKNISGKNISGGNKSNHGAEKFYQVPAVEVVRARAVYMEVMDGIPDVAARVLSRIDALCDPERTDEAATLRSWREKYDNTITVRRKDRWWRRLNSSQVSAS